MDVHQAFGQGAQQPERYNAPVHTARITPIYVDLASENHLLFATVNLVFIGANGAAGCQLTPPVGSPRGCRAGR